MFSLKKVLISGEEVLPLVEGGKGVSISTGDTSGAWAAADAVGTVSIVNANVFNFCDIFSTKYSNKTRKERNEELLKYSIEGAVQQIKIAFEKSCGNGRIHINALWEMSNIEKLLTGVMDRVKGLVNGITCGAGLPYKLAEIASKYKCYYYPIVSSSRAFQILYKRSYNKFKEFLGGVVYEDPWFAGGHIGISNAENINEPESPYLRIKSIRKILNDLGLMTTPIIIAGGVWWLSEWQDYIDNPEIGDVAFQFGTRPLLTKESPIAESWKRILLNLKKEDICINKFSPTGFYSSAIKNNLLNNLIARSSRQFEYRENIVDDFNTEINFGRSKFIVRESDIDMINEYKKEGFDLSMRTPDSTFILVTKDEGRQILSDQGSCVGCLSHCHFSNWSQHTNEYFMPDPRSFCIQKSLQNAAQGKDLDNNLIFVGRNAYRFSEDPLYSGGYIPSTRELIDRILTGF